MLIEVWVFRLSNYWNV